MKENQKKAVKALEEEINTLNNKFKQLRESNEELERKYNEKVKEIAKLEVRTCFQNKLIDIKNRY